MELFNIGSCGEVGDPADLSDLKAALAEHGMVAVPIESPGYALDILKRVRDGELGNCRAYDAMIKAAQEQGDDLS